MCTYINEINQVVDEFTAKGLEFTAHDVTKEVRRLIGHSQFIDHQQVRREVASRFDSGLMLGYVSGRGIRQNPLGTVHPTVYSPVPPTTVPDANSAAVPDGNSRASAVQDSLKVSSFWNETKDFVNRLFSTKF